MEQYIPVVNETLELADCRGKWFFDKNYSCWCLEDVLYTRSATTPKFQRLSIFAPEPYMTAGGTILPEGKMGRFTAQTAPVVFENNSAGYMQMPHTWLGGPRDSAGKYLARGMVYVTCGCRGRESRDGDGKLCAKSPWSLVDLKTGIRFLRHNAAALPGDTNHMISVGWSAGSAGTMNAFQAALSQKLAADYVNYFNGLGLKHPESNAPLTLNQDGRSGSGYDYLMGLLEDSAADYLTRLGAGELPEQYSIKDYLLGRYIHQVPAPFSGPGSGADPRKDDLGLHHAGAAVMVPPAGGDGGKPMGPPSLGDLVSRPPKGVPYVGKDRRMLDVPGNNKTGWLSWDGEHARISAWMTTF